jgi:hypothetical protein
MVDAHPNLKRRFINTNEIITAANSHLVPDLYSKHPEDYISIQTHKTIERIKPMGRNLFSYNAKKIWICKRNARTIFAANCHRQNIGSWS